MSDNVDLWLNESHDNGNSGQGIYCISFVVRKISLIKQYKVKKKPNKPKIAPLAPMWLYVSGLIRKVAMLARIPVDKRRLKTLRIKKFL